MNNDDTRQTERASTNRRDSRKQILYQKFNIFFLRLWALPGKASRQDNRVINSERSLLLILLLLSRFSRIQLCVTPKTAAHQAPPSLGFSRQEYWSGVPFPSPMHESEKWKWSRSVVSNSERPHGLQPTRLLHPWDFPGKSTGVGCHCLLLEHSLHPAKFTFSCLDQ